MTVSQVPTTVVHKTECDGQAVASSGLQGVLRKDVSVSLALCEYSSAELIVCITALISLLLSNPPPSPHTLPGHSLAHLHEGDSVLEVGA